MTKKRNRTVLTRQEVEEGEKRAKESVNRRQHKDYEVYLREFEQRSMRSKIN